MTNTVGPELAKSLPTARPPRICMPVWEKISRKAYHGGRYEWQDVIAGSDDVEVIVPEPTRGFSLKEIWYRRLVWRDVSKRLAYVNPGLKPIRLTKDYDLLVVHCQTWWELFYLNAIQNWKERCKTSLCYIDEMWAATVPQFKPWIQSLNRFDHVVLGMRGTVQAVSEAIGRPCHFVPVGIDALRFTPYPNPPERVVEVFNIGRRWEGIHRPLLEYARAKGLFYVYDTLQTGGSLVPDYKQHRDLIANIAKRSRYFMVAPGKMNASEETKGQVETGLRYFEGLAAGTVLIGQPPDSEQFRKMFPWPDAVIPLNPDGSDLVDILEGLAKQPERLSAISRRNSAEALLRHDCVYRWKELLAIAGLDPGPSVQIREDHLRKLADIALGSSAQNSESDRTTEKPI
jgi:hypothetical protein